MKHLFGFLIAATMLASTGFISYEGDDWALAKDSNTVRVYTRVYPGSKMKEFKGEMVVKATPEKLLGIMKDGKSFSNWMHNTYGSYVIKSVSDNEYYCYMANKAPWPVQDRDNVIRYLVKRPNNRTVVLEMTAMADFIPRVDGCVRVEKMKGTWVFESIGNGQSKVTQQVHAEPGGNIPAWLANSAVVDNPYNTLLGLKKWSGG